MNKIELQDPTTKTIIATRDLNTARELLAHGWQPVQAHVVTKEAKK